MAKFTDDDKAERSNKNYFTEGIHEVQIEGVTGGVSDSGSEYFEFSLLGAEGQEGTARVYFTDAAKPYSFNTVRSIFVHNTESEEGKEKMREKVGAVKDTDDLLKLCQALRGKMCWLMIEDAGTTYTSERTGKTYKNFNRNIYGYEPKPRTPQAQLQQAVPDAEKVETPEDVFPFQ